MKRLTEKRNGLNVIPLRRDGSPEWCVSQNQNDGTISVFGAAADTLAAYEDTGLTPEEIEHIKEEHNRAVNEASDFAVEIFKVVEENLKLRELLKLAVEDMKKVTTNVAFEGLVCGGECVHFGDCERVKNNDDRMYRCRKFKWRHADEVAEILKEVQNA